MKIYEGQGPILHQVSKKTKEKGSHESDFKKIIDQINSPSETKEKIDNLEKSGPVMGGIHILNGVEHAKEPLGVTEKRKVIGELKETLDLVDFYAAKLADSNLSLNGITPLVNHLEYRLETLRNMESAPGMPERLRPVISDMATTIGTEISRFKRGDYS